MTCSSNSTTIQDLDNMYRFRFLLEKDRKKLVALINGRVSTWIKNWTFSSDFSLNLNKYDSVKFDISDATLFEKIGAKDHLMHCNDAEFNWDAFLLDQYLDTCPRNKLLARLIVQVKDSFFLDVFELKRSDEHRLPLSESSTFSGTESIDVVVPSVGVLTLSAHQSTWYSMLNEPVSKPTRSKLAGRFSAVENLKVHAEVSANLGRVPFLELVNLPESKLLQFSSDIDNLFKININGLPLCDVALGKVGTHKAVLIQEISK
jgi:hypothetical protein